MQCTFRIVKTVRNGPLKPFARRGKILQNALAVGVTPHPCGLVLSVEKATHGRLSCAARSSIIGRNKCQPCTGITFGRFHHRQELLGQSRRTNRFRREKNEPALDLKASMVPLVASTEFSGTTSPCYVAWQRNRFPACGQVIGDVFLEGFRKTDECVPAVRVQRRRINPEWPRKKPTYRFNSGM